MVRHQIGLGKDHVILYTIPTGPSSNSRKLFGNGFLSRSGRWRFPGDVGRFGTMTSSWVSCCLVLK